MTKEFPKSFEPQKNEKILYDTWIKNKLFSSSDSSKKKPFSILMPPPNVTGILHFGHVLNLTLQDIYIRFKKMKGYETCWFPGIDHAGIATQSKVEAELKKEGISRYDLGREKFVEKVFEWKEKYGGIILQQMRELGVSVDWERTLFTMDEGASAAVQEVFIRLFDEGLIYKGKRIINWSPLAQTALSDEEVEFKEVKEYLYTLRYYFKNSETNISGLNYLKVATVRPETIFGDTAVAVNPNDNRYKHLIGQKVCVPLTNRYIEIIGDDYADPAFGTGCVKITPAHDPNDFLVGQRHNLEVINTINPDATLNNLTGEFSGLERFTARKQILEKLKTSGLIEKIEDYTHNVGFSQRGGEPIEPYLSDQWFVSMKSLAKIALKPVVDGEIKFHPPHWSKTYEHWMNNIRDWCISRQLWWGHRIPVYYTEDGRYAAARSAEEACVKLKLPEGTPLVQDEDSLDTWFSSWLWPLTTMGWLGGGLATTSNNTNTNTNTTTSNNNSNREETTLEMQKFLPTDLLVTAPEIIFFWVARMIMASVKFANKIPFRDVYFTSIIRDGQGRKLSKSLGNSPDPLNIIAKYGADAVRFSMIYLSPLGQDVRMDVDVEVQDISSMEIGRNFANKIWNAGRFLSMKKDEAFSDSELHTNLLKEEELSYADRWILSRYNSTLAKINEALDNYKVTDYAKILYDFIWRDFCDWYVEMLKVQFNTSEDVIYKQHLSNFSINIYENILKIIHPVMPFITDELYHIISNRDRNTSILLSEFPFLENHRINYEIEEQFLLVQSIVEEVRKLRASINLPSQKLPALIIIPEEKTFEIFKKTELLISSLCKFNELKLQFSGVRAGAGISSIETTKPEGATSTVFRGIEIYLIISGAIDLDKERQRLEKEIARLENNICVCENKLKNEKFVGNASEEIVQNERIKLASMQESLIKNKENLKNLVK